MTAREPKWKLYPELQQRQREREAEEKQRLRFVVVMHSENSGYVVRTGRLEDDGSVHLPQPYGDAPRVRIYTSKILAQRYADKLNGET